MIVPATSGDLAADRRYLWGEASRKEGDLAGAADLFRQATECAPHWPAAWFALGETLVRMGQSVEARAALSTCLALAPGDPFGAGLHLARLDGRGEAQMSESYVARLFDDYAGRFDVHLMGSLAYKGPAIIRAALERACAPGPLPFRSICDLGCGTGLMAREIADLDARIDGVDLSAGMLAKAEATGLYRTLAVADGVAFLEAADDPYDLFLAADVFVYVGDLAPVLAAAARRATPASHFAFTVQAAPGDGFEIGEDLRFAHSARYLRAAAAAAGWNVLLLDPAVTRKDAGRDVPGFVVVLARDGA